MKTPTSTSTPLQNNFEFLNGLSPLQIEALKFGIGSTFLGTSGGLLFGGVTTLMRGIQDTPAGRANMIRSFKLFSKKPMDCLI